MTQGKVISLGMKEMKWTTADLNQINKSQCIGIYLSVKEQRVDGSSVIYNICKVYSSHRETGSWEKFNNKYIDEVTQD
jgi:hypothetical protein